MSASMEKGESEPNALTRWQSIWNAIECRRNVIAFWIFGMTTNFIFVISLSAAHDILDPKRDLSVVEEQTNSSENGNKTSENEHNLYCNPAGTGVLLLSTILPEFLLKIAVQFSPRDIPYSVKVGITVISGWICFSLYAFGNRIWIRMIGAVSSGIALGIGETTFVPLTSFYEKNTVSAWSSGTGAAGLSATLVYAGLMSIGVSHVAFMMAMLAVPALIAVTYIFMLKPDTGEKDNAEPTKNKAILKNSASLTVKKRLQLLPSLFKYVLSLCLSYLTVYFINQGLTELLYFNDQIITRPEQYRWYQVVYRVGVFISRLGLKFLIIKNLWVSPLILSGIVAILTFQLFERFIPYLWIVMLLVFVEGLFNGVAYVSTFMHATNNVESTEKEFTLGLITLSGPLGMFLAGAIATPFHNYVCSLNLKI